MLTKKNKLQAIDINLSRQNQNYTLNISSIKNAFKYLGIRVTLNQNYSSQYDYLFQESQAEKKIITNSTLNHQEISLWYKTTWLSKIRYSTWYINITIKTWGQIDSIILSTILHKLKLNQKFPRTILFTPYNHGVIG